jgi:hypothetical protein
MRGACDPEERPDGAERAPPSPWRCAWAVSAMTQIAISGTDNAVTSFAGRRESILKNPFARFFCKFPLQGCSFSKTPGLPSLFPSPMLGRDGSIKNTRHIVCRYW